MITYTARSLASKNATAVLKPVGTAVLVTIQGMAQAIFLGVQVYRNYDKIANCFIPNLVPDTAEVLQTLRRTDGL